MTVYTKQWNAEHKKLAAAKSKQNSLTSAQAKLISQGKNYQSKIDNANDTIKKLNKKKKLTTKEKETLKKAETSQMVNSVALASLKESKNYKQANSKVKNAAKSVSKAQAELSKYEAARHKTALERVAQQTQQNYSRYMAPHASLHATNSMTGLTVFLFATNESESNDSDVTTYPIDEGEPVSDHVRRTGKTINITGYLYDQEAAERLWPGSKNDVSGSGLPQKSVADQYANLNKWQFQGTELVYKSNSTDDATDHHMNTIYVGHVVMSNLTKTLEKPYSGMMAISFTLSYIYKATVKTTSKPSKNNKGKTKAQGNNVGATKITVKKGMTYWGLAQTYHTTVAQLRKWNGSEKVTMYPDKNGKYPKKLQVTAGKRSATKKK